MHHQPGVRVTGGCDCVIEIRPALLASSDDVRASSNLDADRDVKMPGDRRDDSLRIGVAAVEQFAEVGGDQADARQVDETQYLSLGTVDCLTAERVEVV